MRICEFVDSITDAQFEYEGDPDAKFSGLALTPRGAAPGRFLIVRDDSWPKRLDEPTLPSYKHSERLVKRAFDAGASGAILPFEFRGSEILRGRNAFFANDTYRLACSLAQTIRDSLGHQRITAITGSAGKTTTKAMLTHALRAVGINRVASNPGNVNRYRQTLRLLSQSYRFDHTVIEAASSTFKAFRENTFSISPDVSVITSIAEAHLSQFGSLENVAKIKSDIFQFPPPGGTAVINRDTSFADALITRAVQEGCQIVTYGESEEATIRLVSWDPDTRRTVAAIGQERVVYHLSSEGKHIAINSVMSQDSGDSSVSGHQ